MSASSNKKIQSGADHTWHRSLGIRGRLMIGFSTLIAFFIISVCITIFIVTESKTSASRFIDVELPTYDSFIDMSTTIYISQMALRGLAINSNEQSKQEFDDSVSLLLVKTQRVDNQTSTWFDSELLNKWQQQARPLVNQLLVQYQLISNQPLDKINNQLIVGVVSKTMNITNDLMTILDGPKHVYGERSGGMLDGQYDKIDAGSHNIIANMNTVIITEYIVILLGVIASFIIVYLTSRSIIRHINLFREYSNRIASGDLRQSLEINGNDEIANLGVDLNVMTDNLAAITKQIAISSHNIVSTLEEVKQAVNVQSSGASEQASSINEVTASLEEIEKSSEQTMEKAKALGDVAERTREKGQQGLESVEQSIQGMKSVREKVQLIAQTILELSTQTQQVGEITNVVNGLAQQSKMLALNASIEAAKAGEAGKGFAVVASEVKNLAEQSEQSTAQVQKILEDIRHATEKAVIVTEEGTKGVDYGTNLVEQTGEIVRSLSDIIHEATLASQQIEAAVRQEGVGIEQITAGMNEINQVTGSFVASSQQTLEAITQLSEISKKLKERVDTYKI